MSSVVFWKSQQRHQLITALQVDYSM